MARSAAKEATAHLRHALQALAALPDDDERRRRELEMQAALGAASIAAHGYAAAGTGAAFDRARELCEAGVGDARLLARVFFGQAAFRLVGGQLHRSLEGIEGLLRTGVGRRDRVCTIVAHRGAGAALVNLGRNRPAAERLEQVLVLYDLELDRDLAFEFGQDLRLTAECWLTFARFALGQVDQATTLIGRAMREVGALRHFNTEAMVTCFGAVLASLLREPDTASRYAAAIRASAVDHGMPFWIASAENIHGWATVMLGDAAGGVAELRRGLRALLATGSRFWLPYYHALLGDGLASGGWVEDALAALDEGLGWAARTGERWFEAELLRRKGEALARLGSMAAASAALEDALRVAREQEALTWELRAATSLARLRVERGEQTVVADLLAPIYARFTEGFSTPDLRDAKTLLDGTEPTR
jgi:predicted ATPase